MTTIESAATTIREPGAGFEFDEPQLVQMAARDADPRTTTLYDRRRQNFDRHAAYVVVAFRRRRLTPSRLAAALEGRR